MKKKKNRTAMQEIKHLYRTDIFGEFAIWAWGKEIPSEIIKLQRFMRKSPLGKYIRELEKTVRDYENEELI